MLHLRETVYFRFSSDEQGTHRLTGWEARSRSVGEQTSESRPQSYWLTRLDFRRDGEELLARMVAMLYTIEARA